jgi:hypothetical protein
VLVVLNMLVLFIGVYILIKEVAQPLVKGRQIFPSFRKSQARKELDTAKQELLNLREATEIEKELELVKVEKSLLTKNGPSKNEST